MVTRITNLKDVVAFTSEIIDHGVVLHPDNDFHDYISMDSGKPTYTKEEADLMNNLMKDCFRVCRREKKDIYDLMMYINLKKTGMDQLIPLPDISVEGLVE